MVALRHRWRLCSVLNSTWRCLSYETKFMTFPDNYKGDKRAFSFSLTALAMPYIELNFALQTPPNIRTIHLVGSWDNYSQILVLHSTGVKGAWSRKFRFPISILKPGHRYGYYYIVDDDHINPDDTRTRTKLEFMDIPKDTPEPESHNSSHGSVIYGITPCISSIEIQHPQPSKSFDPNVICKTDFAPGTNRLSGGNTGSPLSVGNGSSCYQDSHRSSGTSQYSDSSISTFSSLQPPTQENPGKCHCERYGITRTGDRVKLDCGGISCEYLVEVENFDCSESTDNEDQDSIPRNDIRRWGMIFH